MDVKINELADILKKQSEIHEELISSAQIMNSYIKEKNTDGIQDIVSRYDYFTAQIEELESKRLVLCDEIAIAKLATKSHLNLKQLLDVLKDEDEKNLLNERRNNLKEKIAEFSLINSKNNILIQDRISDIDSNVKMIADHVNKAAAYGKHGKMSEGKVNRHMLNRMA